MAAGFMGRPNEPFLWGRGGKRMTPEDLTLQRRLAAQQLQTGADFSPLGHWTQGLARLANGVAGGLQMRRADRAGEANAEESAAVMKALLAPPVEGQPDPVAAALSNPFIDDTARKMAMEVWESRQPKAVQPTEFARLMAERDALPPDSPQRVEFDRYIAGKSDPQVTVTLPGGGIFVGPQSELANVLGGGAAPPAGPPATLPPDFDFQEMTPASAGPVLSAASQAQSITAEEAARIRASLGPNGQAAFEEWKRNNNIVVR